MKNKSFKNLSSKVILVFSAITLVIVGLSSCNIQDNEACAPNPKAESMVTLNWGDFNANTKVGIWNDSDNEAFRILTGSLENKSLHEFIKYFKLDIKKTTDFHLNAIVLFLSTQNIDRFDNPAPEDIAGISIYQSDKGKMLHNFFMRKNGYGFEEIKGLKGYTSGLYYKNMLGISQEIISSRKSYNGYLILTNNTKYVKPEKDEYFDQIPLLIKQYSAQNNNALDSRYLEPECGGPCEILLETANCEWDPTIPAYDCTYVAGACDEEDASEVGGASQETQESNAELHYNFRDNFLINSSFGQDYMYYYYLLSNDPMEMTVGLATDILELFVLVNPSIEEALKPEAAQSSYILITTEIQQKAVDIINQYRALTSNEELLDIFDQVENDINAYVGLTAAEVLGSCCSN